jgi:hypothetical protein
MASTITQDSVWKEGRFPNLETQVGRQMWATPTASGGGGGTNINNPRGQGNSLASAVKLSLGKWPTPTAHNAKETNAPSESNRNTPTLAAQAGGQLNPMWVAWLMGFPIEWVNLKG